MIILFLYLVKIICLYLFLNWFMFGPSLSSSFRLFHSVTKKNRNTEGFPRHKHTKSFEIKSSP